MREGFGGAFLMYMILIFITIFVVFMAVTLKYVQAFRAKNNIINYIEQYEGYNNLSRDQIKSYLDNYGYKVSGLSSSNKYGDCDPVYGYCVLIEYCNGPYTYGNVCSSGSKVYYKVTSFISLDFGNILGLGTITVPVSGETRSLMLQS